MKAILDEMLAALSRGERVVLCSILASSGSVPRGAGAKMAVFEDDRVLGTIGGGAVERLSIQRAQDALKNGGSNELKSYNLHPSEVASTGMICGGAVTVYFQFSRPSRRRISRCSSAGAKCSIKTSTSGCCCLLTATA